MNRLALFSLLVLAGCEGLLTNQPPPPGPEEDAGVGDCTPEQAELEKQAGAYLQVTCAHAGCHLPAGPRSPNLAAANLGTLSMSGHVVPGRSDSSSLLFRMTTSDPRLAMPPTQAPAAGQPYVNADQVELVRRWIDRGAKTGCTEAPPPPPADVNAIPQDTLFTCTQPVGLEPRYRRLGSPEWIHAFGGAQLNPAMVANPLSDSRGPYTTFSRDQSLDVTSLQLYLDVLANSRTFSPGPVIDDWSAWYRDARTGMVGFPCITDPRIAVANVGATCRADFIDALLTRVLARTPTPDEQTAMRGFLDQKLAAEASEAERQKTLRLVYEATFVLPGALFQAEGSSGGALSSDEYAQLLASALGTHAASNFITGYSARPELAWLPAFRAAQDAGTVDLRAEAARVFALENGFVGGEWPATAPARPDLQNDWGNTEFLPSYFEHDPLRARRGRYWLAPRIAGFFREYFDYGKVGSVAKDLPAATSAFDLHDPALHGPNNNIATWASASWRIFVGDDPTFTQYEPFYDAQLDDTIARMVVTAERDGQDVFRALFTGTTFRTAASTGGDFMATRPTGCDVDLCARTMRPTGANCCTDGQHQCVPHSIAADGGVVGMCASPTWEALWLGASFPYGGATPMTDLNTAPVGADVVSAVLNDPLHEQRWKTLPTTERSGVLTHPAWLAAHGANAENGPSAVVRGYWIREHLFCESVAGLDLVQLRAQLGGDPRTSARSRLDATFGPAAQELRCSNGACHALMNPLGMPFEIYNHAGFVRTFDHGAPPNGSSTIPNWPGRGQVAVADALELNRLLAEDPHARRCFLRHVFRYFVGRHETAADACVLGDMETAFAGGSLFAALEALYAHDAMLTRAQR
jgi:hypothetical protein